MCVAAGEEVGSGSVYPKKENAVYSSQTPPGCGLTISLFILQEVYCSSFSFETRPCSLCFASSWDRIHGLINPRPESSAAERLTAPSTRPKHFY